MNLLNKCVTSPSLLVTLIQLKDTENYGKIFETTNIFKLRYILTAITFLLEEREDKQRIHVIYDQASPSSDKQSLYKQPEITPS